MPESRTAEDLELPTPPEPDDFPEIVRLDSLEWGHRFTYDGTAGPSDSREDALALAARFRPGYVEIVHRVPGGEWERAAEQPHTTAQLLVEFEAVRDRLQALVDVRGRFMTRLPSADFQEWRDAERALDAPRSRYWAVWSTHAPARLLKLMEYDDRPRTEAEARADLPEPVVPLTGGLEPIDRARLEQLRETYEMEKRHA